MAELEASLVGEEAALYFSNETSGSEFGQSKKEPSLSFGVSCMNCRSPMNALYLTVNSW